MRKRMTNERGAALLETAITLPIILFVCVGVFEFGRAFQTWQVITNASREGARAAVINGTTTDQVKAAVIAYAKIGGIPQCPVGRRCDLYRPHPHQRRSERRRQRSSVLAN